MCGISGITTANGSSPDPHLLRQAIARLGHRGPDASGVHCENGVGLAHARLSIIDIAGGRQPMSIDSGGLCITFNGEIFNYLELREELVSRGHKFATRSDTEVILHLYQEEGEKCVHRMNGQWAFAIWDRNRRRLFLSRDRMGVRPLFYTHTQDTFLFASEIKALLVYPQVKAELDLEGLNQIFTLWVTVPPRTAFRNICQVPPGHSIVVERGQVHVTPYWNLQYTNVEDETTNETALKEELLDLLLDATRIRLRSDVPVGAYLSGGLDSTLVAALTHQLVGERLRTFSISFADAEFDESKYQIEGSRYIHSQHSEVQCSYANIANVFPDVIWHTEQPIIRSAPAPLFRLSKLVHDSGYKVVVTGEGADEVLGGYDIFKEAKIRRFCAQNLGSHRRALLLKRLYPYMEGLQRQPQAYLENFFHVTQSELNDPCFSHLPRWELTAKLKQFYSEDVRSELARVQEPVQEIREKLPISYFAWEAFNQAQFLEAKYLLPGYILSSQGDRMAMAHSVECRYPFLDYRVVEFAAKLPPRLKMNVLNEKYLLKQAARGLIPDSIRTRKKQPYRAPDGKSFFSTREGYVCETLSGSRIKDGGVFDARSVQLLVDKFQSGRATSVKDNMALTGILSTQLLLERFICHRPGGKAICRDPLLEVHAASS